MDATRCQCGAITVTIDEGTFSMMRPDFIRLFPGKNIPRKTMANCDWCVNHWGIGLCGCGSGRRLGRCGNRLPECRRPAQDIEGGLTRCTTDGGGWGHQANHRSPFGPGA